ncbi:putative amino acid transporter, transmembrane domain-containing protein [Rosa chinensis]|uniref:Putative amino acid transporter, transmembrane domain-containing protein n=1 Tax=Rosa chinensis TaxID=74649 RepID=A0A2P6Q076_ROSCH|nr:amino acid permease 8 [Rosa chinensis]PRQ27566.1 putative amino acid transporter, transmembrane domain-containing protein [Rosa chinensis]
MALSEVEAEFQHDLSESGLNNPAKYGEAGEELQVDDDGKLKRTGTVWTACAHIITASIGAGVLSLAWAMAQLGWLAGIFILLFCTFAAGYASTLLADCYRFPDPVSGKRNYSYMEAVKVYLGGTMHKICGWMLYLNLATIGVGFTITTAKSLVAIQKSSCHRKNGEDSPCMFSNIPHMVGFGLVEILLSQLQNFHKLTWLSKLAAMMSFVYATIGIGLSLAKIISGDGGTTYLAGADESSSEKIWMMFIAAGDIAFACSYSLILFDIQDTLKSSPPENKVMKRAVVIGGLTMALLFMMCGSLGYAAFGNITPENLLAGFGDEMPWAFWLLDLANFCIVVHIVGAFQVLCQPVFRIVELLARRRWPKSNFITKENLVILGKMKFNINMFRLTWRTSFVVLVTVIAMAMPFFTDMLALLGAIGYWPLIVYVPIEMHIVQNKIQKQTLRWFGLQLLSFLCLLLSLAAASGSIYGLHKGLGAYKLFQVKE